MKVSNTLETLLQFIHGPVWDGNVASKFHRDRLVDCGYIQRSKGGMQFLTLKGVEVLVDLGYLHSESWRKEDPTPSGGDDLTKKEKQ